MCKDYDNRLANASYIAKRIEKAIRDHPTIPVQQLKNRILSKCNVDVSRFKVMRAKREALERIRGDDAKQYELLWDYCETVRSCNPGSKLLLRKVENSDPPVFDRMYFSLWALKKGFLEGCRPIIGLDGCFLKTVYGGQLLVAVGRDGNDNMFPIAMAVVQVENRDSWGWFVGELLDDIGGLGTSKWSFISDRQKGLVEALKDLVPDSEHRFCVRHMYENFKMKWKSVELKEYFWKAASTANKREFENFMKKIEELDPKIKPDVETASEWLKKISPEHWARSHFPVHSKCDILVNNLCESFNNYILEARDKPIISMIEWIRTRLMSRLQVKREGMEKYGGSICPTILKKINKQQKAARNCFIRWCGGEEYEIDHFLNKYVVDLEKKTCSCGMFQLTGYPCCHACAAIGSKRARLEDYVDDFYTKAVYLKVYTEMIHAVPGANEAVHAEIPQVAARKRRQPAASRSATQVAAGGRIPNPEAAQPPTESSATQQQIGYQGPRNASLLGKNPATSSIPTTRRYNKRPSISEVLDKMKERQKRRQQD
ncbi:UNVERIFIED_CONTAM: hypothetical protein Sradi_1585300 [Sesamum radiatum]|uniref:SWIM-type domain-containing protein n=1 Tax=Sesamum radiatum TaxID=300843 RepID=A0AAW2UD83_SESRA